MANTTYPSGRPGSSDFSSVADEARNVATDVLDDASDLASRAQEQATTLGRKAVDQFNAATDYIRGHDVSAMMDDAKSWVRAHPTQALIAAVALGFVAAAVIRRR